jgi:hypothetical protein
VEAVSEDRTAPLPEAIEGPRDPHEQSLHATRQRAAIVGLRNQVDVVRLQRVLRQPESEAIPSGTEDARDRAPSEFPPEARRKPARRRIVTCSG